MPMSHRSWKERKSSCIFWMEKIIMKGSMYLFHFISYIFLILQKTFPSRCICLQVPGHDFNCFLQDFFLPLWVAKAGGSFWCWSSVKRQFEAQDHDHHRSISWYEVVIFILADRGNALVLLKCWEVCRQEASFDAIVDEIRVHFRQCSGRMYKR